MAFSTLAFPALGLGIRRDLGVTDVLGTSLPLPLVARGPVVSLYTIPP